MPLWDPFRYVRHTKARLESTGWWHSFELPNGTRIEGAVTVKALQHRVSGYQIPEDLRGKRVLDIGAWDGWYSFEMERRGADVLAIDVWDNPRFHEIHSLLGSSVEYRTMDVYDLTPERVGRFDIVLFLGVLYHLKHPLLALERVCSVTGDLAIVDSFVLKRRHWPWAGLGRRRVMEFYETDELGGEIDNWVGPSIPCLLALCRTAGFARVQLRSVVPHSACVACYRTWDAEVDGHQPAPSLTAAFHHTNYGINFSSQRDDYVVCWFDTRGGDLGIDDVRPDVAGFGTRPIRAARREQASWLASFKLPPGLSDGWHPVRVRVRNGPPSNSLPVAVDVPLPEVPVTITGVADGTTWEPNRLERGAGTTLCLWVEGLPQNADRGNVKATLGSRPVPVTHVEPAGTDQNPRQVNVEVPKDVPLGRTDVSVVLGSQTSEPAPVEILA